MNLYNTYRELRVGCDRETAERLLGGGGNLFSAILAGKIEVQGGSGFGVYYAIPGR